jgi:tetratricopeptide (TPR) repeat protein
MQPPTVEASQQGELSSKIVKLLEAIDNEENHEEDRFQAQVCVGWLHWVFAEYSQALSRLPKQEESQFDAASVTLQWTTISALKATYLRADSLTRNHERTQALATFQAGLPLISNVWSGSRLSSQLRYWSELYMTEFCVLWDVALEDGDVSLQDANALSCYRAWAKYWETVSSSVTGGYGFKGSIPRRKVWENYYLALSQILEEDLPIPTGYVNKITNDLSARNQLRVELKSAEASYQALLLSETTFPRAEEGRPEVEAFVKRVVKNWAIMCGRGWQEQDLGQGGRSSLSRGVLDTLYSAATKTYHSPAILRFLFLLHLSVAEFDLAFRAFDSYMDIVKKVKARVDKTGKPDESLDEDGIVLETISQAIMALCRYGNQQAAEKAHQLGAELEDWLAKLPQLKPSDTSAATTAEEKEKIQMLHPPVPPQIVALAWQAIGLAHAHWSRVTHEATSRTEIQSKAVRCLRRSLSAELGRSKDIRSFFTLGLLLAERRELTAAIDLIKAALISSRGPDEENNVLYGAYWRERSLIPVWNLLALLLSARQDYVMAARACEGALEQFNDPSVLFGTGDSTFRSEHLNDAEKTANSTQAQKGLVDDMDDAEKESILEVKMTQLALVELLEGPEVAVNASFELLTLYSRLFGSQPTQSALNLPKATEPPKTAATHKSIRGSIFGRQPRAATREPSGAQVSDLGSVEPSRPATAQTVASTAPTIQVTEDNGAMANHPRYQRGTSVHRQRSESGRRNSLKKKNRIHSRQRSSSAGEASHKATVVDGEQFFTPSGERDQNDFFTNSSRMPPPISSAFTRSKTLRSLKSQVSMNSKATDQSEPAIEGIYASTNLLPLIQFPKDKEKSQRTAILIKVWLVIAGFYRRAGMYDDCRGAIGEAQKLVQNLDSEATREPSGASGSIKGATWAEEKSVDDLWGDVFTEVS